MGGLRAARGTAEGVWGEETVAREWGPDSWMQIAAALDPQGPGARKSRMARSRFALNGRGASGLEFDDGHPVADLGGRMSCMEREGDRTVCHAPKASTWPGNGARSAPLYVSSGRARAGSLGASRRGEAGPGERRSRWMDGDHGKDVRRGNPPWTLLDGRTGLHWNAEKLNSGTPSANENLARSCDRMTCLREAIGRGFSPC